MSAVFAGSLRLCAETETNGLCADVAGMAGLEPTISESKSGVLPLHYIPPRLRVEAGIAGLPLSGVGDGARTHDTRNHNPVLIPTELHPPFGALPWHARRDSNPRPTA